MPSDHAVARHALGRALGAAAGECRCAVCGASPFAAGRPTTQVCGPLFTDYDLLVDGYAPDVCEGCALVLGGKPSKENPPLRMGHIAVVDGVLERPDGERMVELLRDPPAGLEVLCWTASRQRHASLRAGVCTPEALYIGTETGTIEWVPSRDVVLLDAVSTLRASAFQTHILSGEYPPHVLVALGSAWEPAEAVVARYRPSLSLDMAVALVRRPPPAPEAPMPIDERQRQAADLLLSLSWGSADRDEDPIRYWSALLPRRLAAACGRGRTLTEIASLLMEGTRVSPLSTGALRAVETIEALTEDEAREIAHLWTTRPRIVIATTRLIKEES